MQMYANRHANLPQRMGRWGGHVQIWAPESLDCVSVLVTKHQGSPNISVHRVWFSRPALLESKLSHSISSLCLYHVV